MYATGSVVFNFGHWTFSLSDEKQKNSIKKVKEKRKIIIDVN